MKEITKALLKAQGEFTKIEKDSKNPHFKSEYASLPKALSTILPVLRDNNILFTTSTIQKEGLNYTLIKLIHVESGEILESHLPILNTTDAQKLGACITYNQRYGLLPLLGIAADMDDDGNTASNKNDVDKNKKTQSTNEEKINIINNLIKEHNYPDDIKLFVEKSLKDKKEDGIFLDNLIVRLRTMKNENIKSRTK